MTADTVFLSEKPATARHWRWTGAVALTALLMVAALGPFGGRPWARRDWFIPIYDSVVATLDLVTALLLLSEFLACLDGALLILVAAYGYAASMATVHLLTFPGALAPAGLLGAGPQTTAWVYFAWYGGVGLCFAAYAVARRVTDVPMAVRAPAWATVGTVGAIAAATGTVLLLTTRAQHLLPAIMQGDGDLRIKYLVSSATVAVMAIALPVLLWRRPGSVLDAWLGSTIVVWLCEVALESLLNDGRYSLGWYVGRVFGVAASSLLLAALLVQAGRAQNRVTSSLRTERRQQRWLQDARERLRHSRLAGAAALRSAQAARRAEHELREVSAVRLASREDERRRLARDLHDEFGQLLAAVRFELDALEAKNGQSSAVLADALARLRGLLDLALESLRRVVSNLRPPLLDDLGLEAALTTMATHFTQRHGIACEVRIAPAAAGLPDPLSTAAFRIAQEGLTNIQRHSRARRADIDIDVDEQAGMLAVRIRDDGRGFDPQAPGRSGGLAGIRERVLALGGEVVVDSHPGKGTLVTARIPLDADLAEASVGW